jgi:BolA protein
VTAAASRLASILRDKLNPLRVEVLDESAQHAGHAGASPEGGTHFYVEIVSPAFRGLSRLERHRAVYDALAGEMASGLHALRIKAVSPEETP